MKGSMTEVTDQTGFSVSVSVCVAWPLPQSIPLSAYREGSVHVCESAVKANNIRYLTQKLLFLSS